MVCGFGDVAKDLLTPCLMKSTRDGLRSRSNLCFTGLHGWLPSHNCRSFGNRRYFVTTYGNGTSQLLNT